MKKKTNLKSNCCNAKIKVGGIGDFEGDKIACTIYYVCTKCQEACDVHIQERKTWAINPKTRIVPNKKKDQQSKQAEQDIKELGNA